LENDLRGGPWGGGFSREYDFKSSTGRDAKIECQRNVTSWVRVRSNPKKMPLPQGWDLKKKENNVFVGVFIEKRNLGRFPPGEVPFSSIRGLQENGAGR